MAKKSFISIFEQNKDELRRKLSGCCLPMDIRKIIVSYIPRCLWEIQWTMLKKGKLNKAEKGIVENFSFVDWKIVSSDFPLNQVLPLAGYIEQYGDYDSPEPIDVEEYIAFVENLCRSCDNALAALDSPKADEYNSDMTVLRSFRQLKDKTQKELSNYFLPLDAEKIQQCLSLLYSNVVDTLCDSNNLAKEERQAIMAFADAAQSIYRINHILAKYITGHCATKTAMPICIDDWMRWQIDDVQRYMENMIEFFSPNFPVSNIYEALNIERPKDDDPAIKEKKEYLRETLQSLDEYMLQSKNEVERKMIYDPEMEKIWGMVSKRIIGKSPFFMVVSGIIPLILEDKYCYVLRGKILGGRIFRGLGVLINGGWSCYRVTGIECHGIMEKEAYENESVRIVIEPDYDAGNGELDYITNICSWYERNLRVDWLGLIADVKDTYDITLKKRDLTKDEGSIGSIVTNILSAIQNELPQ